MNVASYTFCYNESKRPFPSCHGMTGMIHSIIYCFNNPSNSGGNKMGTLINCVLIIFGGSIGLVFKKAVNKEMEYSIQKATGIAVLIIGICGVLSTMLKSDPSGNIKSSGEIILVVSLALGTFFGEVLKLEERLNKSCKKIEKKFQISNFSAGFISSTMIYCIGAMAIVGAINDGILGDSSTLITKGIIDGITSIVLAASLGYGVQ